MVLLKASHPLSLPRHLHTHHPSQMRIFIVAGEPSGDVIGSRLMASLKALSPNHPPLFAGIGGALMEREGLHSEFPMEDIAVMGLVELIPLLYRLRVRIDQTVRKALNFKPHVIVTIDSKGFSFSVLRRLRARCDQLKEAYYPLCIHYVAPSTWAWKGGEKRLKQLIGIIDHVLCILPVEEQICRASGLSATFVGHPVLEDVFHDCKKLDLYEQNWQIVGDGEYFRKEHGLSRDATILSLLPGSRMQEVNRMLPIFGGVVDIMKYDFQHLAAVIPTVSSRQITRTVESAVRRWSIPVIILPAASVRDKYNAFAASNCGICTSGTAVLQMQIARLPCVVGYRANIITEWVIQQRTKLKYISLPNILLGSPVPPPIPEALFSDCTPKRLAFLLRQLLEDKYLQQQQVVAASKILPILAPQAGHLLKPSMQAATTILKLLQLKQMW